MALTGYIKLHRSLLDWEWHDAPVTGWLFVNLLLMASHSSTTWRGIGIERGQLVTGRKSLSEQTGLSERQIRTALEHLQKTGEVTITPTNKFSLITIVQFEKFQAVEGKATIRTPAIPPADDQQSTTSEECKKYKKYNSSRETRFTPPTIDEVRAYCMERQNGIDPQAFVNYYDTSGWKRGKTTIKDWRACVRTWERREQHSATAPVEREVSSFADIYPSI